MEKTITVPMKTPVTTVKPDLLRVFDALPPSRQTQVLDFARFLYQQAVVAESSVTPDVKIRPVPATTLLRLTGLVALGGDALADTETLYDDDRY